MDVPVQIIPLLQYHLHHRQPLLPEQLHSARVVQLFSLQQLVEDVVFFWQAMPAGSGTWQNVQTGGTTYTIPT
jgi:hypothetical protein